MEEEKEEGGRTVERLHCFSCGVCFGRWVCKGALSRELVSDVHMSRGITVLLEASVRSL